MGGAALLLLWGEGTGAVVDTGDIPGIEYRLHDARLHLKIKDKRLHYRLHDARLHYQALEE